MQCQEIMKRLVHSAPPQLTVKDACVRMKQGGFGLLPVCNDDGRILGTVTRGDIVLRACAEGLPCEATTVAEIMTPNPLVCGVSDTLERAEQLMGRHQKFHILVVDDSDKLQGIISLSDIAQCEEPLRTARLVREVTARHFRVETGVPLSANATS
jgi:CBS domain-containing protein